MEEILQRILEQLQKAPAAHQDLGFCNPPKTRYIYANRQYPDCLWYFWDGGKSVYEPIGFNAITGFIEKIEIETKEYKGKPDVKINVHIRADRPYVIQSGQDTLFTKGLLYTFSRLPVDAFKQPIMIAVDAGDDEKVLFSRVYNPATGALAFQPYPNDAAWPDVIARAIDKVAKANSNQLQPSPVESKEG